MPIANQMYNLLKDLRDCKTCHLDMKHTVEIMKLLAQPDIVRQIAKAEGET